MFFYVFLYILHIIYYFILHKINLEFAEQVVKKVSRYFDARKGLQKRGTKWVDECAACSGDRSLLVKNVVMNLLRITPYFSNDAVFRLSTSPRCSDRFLPPYKIRTQQSLLSYTKASRSMEIYNLSTFTVSCNAILLSFVSFLYTMV